MKNPIRLLIVDDSRLIRRAICNVFEADDTVQVAGEAKNGAEALEMIPRVDPSVVTLDINMPVMDGLTALKHIMIKSPKPTVMFSTLTQEGADVTFDALKYGAIDFIPKPSTLHGADIEKQHRNIIRKVTLASGVEIEGVRYLRPKPKSGTPMIIFCEDCGGKNIIHPGEAKKKTVQCRACNKTIVLSNQKTVDVRSMDCNYIFAMGACEGGYGALLKIIPGLPSNFPAAFLVVLYEESVYVDAFARYLADHSSFGVKRATDGEPINGGVCYLASGEEYTTINSINNRQCLRVHPAPFSTRRGSINMLMFSVAEAMKEHAVGVILSGSGNDGLEGLGEILRVGAPVLSRTRRPVLLRKRQHRPWKDISRILLFQTGRWRRKLIVFLRKRRCLIWKHPI